MGNWIKCRIADLGDVIGGATPSTKNPSNYKNGTIPWITPKDLSGFSGRYIKCGKRNITVEGLNSCSTQLLPKHSVLFSSRAPIGYVAIAENPVCTNQGFKSVVPNPNTDYMFLYYLLLYNKETIEHMGSGTTFKEVSGSTMRNIDVYVPENIEEQRQIANILSSFDEKIETNSKINDNLLQQAITLFDQAINQSEGLSYADLGKLADVKGGKRLPKGVNLITTPNTHPYIRVRDLNNVIFASLSADYEFVDDETQKSIARYVTSVGDVLISIVGTIGLTAIVDESLDQANLTENCVKITNLNGISPEYLLLYLRSPVGNKAITRGTVGAVQLKLPIKNILAIPIPLLSKEAYESLDTVLKTIFKEISLNVMESKRLAETRDALLPHLMSSKLDVSGVNL